MNRRRFLELLPSIPYLASVLLSSGCLPEPTWRKSWQDAHEKQQRAQEEGQSSEGQGGPALPESSTAPAALPVPPSQEPAPAPALSPVAPPSPELTNDLYTSSSSSTSDERPFMREVARIQQEIEDLLDAAAMADVDPFSEPVGTLTLRETGIDEKANIGKIVLALEEHYLPLKEQKDSPFPAARKKLEEILDAAASAAFTSLDDIAVRFPRILSRIGYQASGPTDTLLSRVLTASPHLDLETIALLSFSAAQRLDLLRGLDGVRVPVIWQGMPGKYGPSGFLVRTDKGNYNPLSEVYESDSDIIKKAFIADSAIERGTYLRPLGRDAILSNALRRIGLAREQSYGDLNNAGDLLYDALQLDPSNVKVHFSLAKLFFKTRVTHAHAVAHLNVLLQKDPRFFHGYEFRAELYGAHGISDRAQEDQKTMRDLYFPGGPKFYTPKRE